MAIREVRKEGDPILRKKCKEVRAFDDKLAILLDDMHETLKNYEGVGLAGPQVGSLKRVFIVEFEGESIEAINPEIIGTEGEQTGSEGCLSLPGLWYEVTRPMTVTLKAFDRHGNEFTITRDGLISRAFCHENDHLDGTLFIDRVSDEQKQQSLVQDLNDN